MKKNRCNIDQLEVNCLQAMNRPVHLLYSVVIFFAVTSISFRIYISSAASRDPLISSTQKLSPVFNASLLTFSAVDLADYSLRRDVEQLLDKNIRVAPLEIRSREYLKEWWDRRWFNPDIMSNIVNTLESRRKYKTCAVVGNSGILLKSNQGKTIDNHEFVIRINNARIIGFEQFAGSKTSLSFTYTDILHRCSDKKGCYCHQYGEKVPIMMYISHPKHFRNYIFCNSSHKGSLMITDPQHDVLCAHIVKYYSVKRFVKETGKSLEAWRETHWGSEFRYSSGMQAVMFALGVCDKVSIFGFGKSDSAKHHYHDNQKNESSLHDYQAEYDLYEDLVKSPGNVPFVSHKFKFPPVIMYK